MNETGHQPVKAPNAAAIRPYTISPRHPANEYKWKPNTQITTRQPSNIVTM